MQLNFLKGHWQEESKTGERLAWLRALSSLKDLLGCWKNKGMTSHGLLAVSCREEGRLSSSHRLSSLLSKRSKEVSGGGMLEEGATHPSVTALLRIFLWGFPTADTPSQRWGRG